MEQDDLRSELRAAVAATIPELMNIAKVGEFVDDVLKKFVEEKGLSMTAATPEQRDQHLRNLKHLVAQVRGRAVESAIRETYNIKDRIGGVLTAVGQVILHLGSKK